MQRYAVTDDGEYVMIEDENNVTTEQYQAIVEGQSQLVNELGSQQPTSGPTRGRQSGRRPIESLARIIVTNADRLGRRACDVSVFGGWKHG